MPLLSKDSRKDGNIITVNGYSSKKKWGEWWHCWILKGEQHEHKTPNDIRPIEMLMKTRNAQKKKFWVRIIKCLLLKYVNRILRRICHANRLLDKCLLEPSMMEVIRSVLRRVRRRNPPILSDWSRGWIAVLGVLVKILIFNCLFLV